MLIDALKNESLVKIFQRKEMAELLGVESRNKYEVQTKDAKSIGFVAEQGKGAMDFVMRNFLGHWRTFELYIFNSDRKQVAKVTNPFRFYFRELNLTNEAGEQIGQIKKKFALVNKKFSLSLPGGEKYSVSSPFWRIWTFPVKRDGKKVAEIRKVWSGAVKEIFTDSDNFEIEFIDPSLSLQAKNLLLAAGVYVDLIYFEKKA